MENEVSPSSTSSSYHRVRGLYFLAGIFEVAIKYCWGMLRRYFDRGQQVEKSTLSYQLRNSLFRIRYEYEL